MRRKTQNHSATLCTVRNSGAIPLLPVNFDSGVVSLDGGEPILDNVTQSVWVTKADGMLVLGLEAPGAPTSMMDIALGVLHCQRWLCCARNKMWWMTPEWGTISEQLPPETQVSTLNK